MVSGEVIELLEANAKFAEDLTRILSAIEKNVIFSPFQIHALLSLLSEDPGYSKKSLHRLLHIFFSEANLAQYYKEILTTLNSASSIKLIAAGNVFLQDKYKLRETFQELIKSNFSYETSSLNFAKADLAFGSINTWIEEKTESKIKNLVKSVDVDKDTRLLLLETLLFNGKWAMPFEIENITPGTFYVNENNTVEVEMMKVKGEFNFKVACSKGMQYLELPFENPNISLLVILPGICSDKNVLDTITHYDITSALNTMSKREVLVTIPKFKIGEDFDLEYFFNKNGVKKEVIDDACLFGMLDGDEFLKPKNIRHKALIDVNENGVIATSGTSTITVPNTMDEVETAPKDGVVIYDMSVKSDISNRFSKTLVTCKITNTEKSSKEASFFVLLPEMAFITEFIMEIQGKSYKSYIKEKEEAKQIYQTAVQHGQGAGLVEKSARDSNKFKVSVNLEPNSVAVFLLTYEEMLQRVHNRYELVLNIQPRQLVECLNVEVNIYESRPLKFVKTPSLRSGNETSKNEKYLEPDSDIKIINEKSAIVRFSPDLNTQKKLARYLQSPLAEGFSGQFVVQYDVERDPQGGEILLEDGYFVHFFAPNDLEPLPKHVMFVLDTSGSMSGRKIKQVKDAMGSILNEIRKNDLINIIEFNSNLIVWDIDCVKSTNLPHYINENFSEGISINRVLPNPTFATEGSIKNAKTVIEKLYANGGTYMIGGLLLALHLVKIGQEKTANKSEKYQPIIIFLTDGQPNVGLSSTEEIVRTVTHLNSTSNKVPIFSLSFGDGADRAFLRKLSLKNMGFSRHIYEASDASLQLQEFYKQISSPLLSNITFKYDTDVEEVTRTHFPIFFRGSELVVSGRYNGPSFPCAINCFGRTGPIIIKSLIERPVTSLERLWAYLTVKQLLEERNSVENKEELTRKAVALALKYSFVTDVTSLVVVKPEVTQATDIESNIRENFAEGTSLFGNAARCSSNIQHRFLGNKQLASLGPRTVTLPGPGTAEGTRFGLAAPQFGYCKFIGTAEGTPFGSAAPQGTSGGTLFGSAAPQGTAGGTLFGSAAPQGTAGGTLFGSAAPQGTAGGTLFGSAAPQVTACFGSVASGAAMSQQSASFGSSSVCGTGFGAATTQAIPQQFSFGIQHSQNAGESPPQQLSFGVSQSQNTEASTQQKLIFGIPQSQNAAAGTQQQLCFGVPQSQNTEAGTGFNSLFGNLQQGAGAQQTFDFGTPGSFFGMPQSQTQRGGNFFEGNMNVLPAEFVVNRPFVILLKLKEDNKTIILFRGRVENPLC